MKNLSDYNVENQNIGSKSLKILFIGESPDTNEIDKGLPLIGKSGEIIKKKLFPNISESSLGEYSQKNNKVGILNVSKSPLRVSFYNEKLVLDPMVKEGMKNIKSLKNMDEIINSIKSFSFLESCYTEFKKELEIALKDKNILIITLGMISQAFLNFYLEEKGEKQLEFYKENCYKDCMILCLSHPSTVNSGKTSWSNQNYKKSIEKVKIKIEQVLVS